MLRFLSTISCARGNGLLIMLLLLPLIAARVAAVGDEQAAPPEPRMLPRPTGLRSGGPGTASSEPSSGLVPDPSAQSVEGYRSLLDLVLALSKRIESLEAKNSEIESQLRAVRNVDEHESSMDDPDPVQPQRRHRDLASKGGVTLRAFNQLKASVTELRNRLSCVSTSSDSGNFILEGCNAHVRNGLGDTTIANGKGNLIVGYNALGSYPPVDRVRTGSHNVVVGDAHAWTSTAGILVGYSHSNTEAVTALLGGGLNSVSGLGSVIVGGQGNTNAGVESVVVGGLANSVVDTSLAGVAVGGVENTVGQSYGLAAGGRGNTVQDSTSGEHSTIVGGSWNAVQSTGNTVVGGSHNELTVLSTAYAVSIGGAHHSNDVLGSDEVSVAGLRFSDSP